MSQAQEPSPETHIHIVGSPFVRPMIMTTAPGISLSEETRYIGFMPPMERTRIQVSPGITEEELS